mmetsp:Transcript_46792/g.117238  ORF Transcript_46792/g.117238 Transcript_46792/m.117238 type:complete len:216 (+) Transcript_46792:319-966(+)
MGRGRRICRCTGHAPWRLLQPDPDRSDGQRHDGGRTAHAGRRNQPDGGDGRVRPSRRGGGLRASEPPREPQEVSCRLCPRTERGGGGWQEQEGAQEEPGSDDRADGETQDPREEEEREDQGARCGAHGLGAGDRVHRRLPHDEFGARRGYPLPQGVPVGGRAAPQAPLHLRRTRRWVEPDAPATPRRGRSGCGVLLRYGWLQQQHVPLRRQQRSA